MLGWKGEKKCKGEKKRENKGFECCLALDVNACGLSPSSWDPIDQNASQYLVCKHSLCCKNSLSLHRLWPKYQMTHTRWCALAGF